LVVNPAAAEAFLEAYREEVTSRSARLPCFSNGFIERTRLQLRALPVLCVSLALSLFCFSSFYLGSSPPLRQKRSSRRWRQA
jgi:hypothetical protein